MMAVYRRLLRSAALHALALLLLLSAVTLAGAAAQTAAAIPPPSSAPTTGPDSIVTFGHDASLAANQITDVVVVFNGDADIAGTVRQSVVVFFGDVVLRPSADVGGAGKQGDPAVVIFGGKLTTQPGATVRGSVNVGKIGTLRLSLLGAVVGLLTDWHVSLWALLPGMIFFLVIGAIVAAIFPGYLRSLRDRLHAKPLPSLGWGALAGFLTPLAILILALTVIGLIVAVPLLLSLPFAGMFVYVVAAYVAGDYALRLAGSRCDNVVLATLVGVVVLAAVGIIPLVGKLAGFLIWCAALGAVLNSIVDKTHSSKSVAANTASAAPPPFVPQ